MRFHYQNLNDDKKRISSKQGPLWQHGRAWLHMKRMEMRWEWLLLTRRASGLSLSVEFGDDEVCAWHLHVGIPFLFGIFFTFAAPWLPVPHGAKVTTDWGSYVPVDPRRVSVSMHDWTVRFALWERDMEHRSTDPWWVRGVSFDLRQSLGRQRYTKEVVEAPREIFVPMPEGAYPAVATLVRCTWSRRFSRAKVRLYWEAEAIKGIPEPGKNGEGDGLFGWSAESKQPGDIEEVIAAGVRSVLRDRRRHAGLDWAPRQKVVTFDEPTVRPPEQVRASTALRGKDSA